MEEEYQEEDPFGSFYFESTEDSIDTSIEKAQQIVREVKETGDIAFLFEKIDTQKLYILRDIITSN